MPVVAPRARHRAVTGRHRRMAANWLRRPTTGLLALLLAAGLVTAIPLIAAPSGAASIVGTAIDAKIPAGTILRAGTTITTAEKQFTLGMQTDGNLVLRAQTRALWSTATNGRPGAWAAMQTDGNLVVYSASGAALWNSQSYNHPGAYGVITTDGNFAVVGTGATYWQTHTVDSLLAPGYRLLPNQRLTAPGSNYVLIMQTDGNLVQYGQSATWSTRTNGNPGAWAVIQSDGNFVVYSATGTALWNSQTAGSGLASVSITDANNVVVTTTAAKVIWQSHAVVTAPVSGGTTAISNAGGTVVASGKKLVANTRVYTADRKYFLNMQSDGNLVIYGAAALWSTRTSRNPGAWAILQSDGNLVVYTAAGKALWSSHTAGTGANSFQLTATGNLTLSTGSGVIVYAAMAGAQGARVVSTALTTLGRPYCFDGGDTRGPTKGIDALCTGNTVGYDCSGLALYAIAQAVGVSLPHYSGSQYTDYARYHGARVARSALMPGDLVFFIGADGTPTLPGHVGIYAGNGKMIDAQQDGVPVAVHSLYNGYIGAVRYWH